MSEPVLRDFVRQHHLSVGDALALCLEYIENQDDPDTFADFLQHAAETDTQHADAEYAETWLIQTPKNLMCSGHSS